MTTAHFSGPCVLSEEQYQRLRAEKSSQEKMWKLYELVPSWNRWRKDQLYRALRSTNRDLVEELEGGHFVDRHQEQLIQQVTEVHKFLQQLRYIVLNSEQYQTIRTGRTNTEKMQKLYELVPSWGREHKDRLYRALWLTNRALIEKLEGASSRVQEPSTSTSPGATGEHFVERHREQLIQRASSVDTVLELLHRRELGPVPDWSFGDEPKKWWMEGTSSRVQEPSTSTSPGETGEHFEEEIRYETVIEHVFMLETKVIDFKNEMKMLDCVELENYVRISDLQTMPILEPESHIVTYDKISAEELASASDLTSEETKSDSSSEAGSIICQQTHLVSAGSAAGAAGETSRSQNPTVCLRGQDKCGWCAREEEVLPEEVKPESIQDPEGKQETYRVHFSQPGWFHCSETELEFEVRAAVTVQYGYGSWDQHLTESQQQQWMVAGPLFDIRVEPAEAVSAVHLPHFLCLKEADSSWVQIAHFLEEGMTLQSPTRVRPFHTVLQNPRFSPIGVILRKIKMMKKKPLIHSLVLLYQAQKRVNLTLHLYLIPNDGSRIKAVKDYEKEFQSWCVSKSHFTSRPLCFGSSCIVSSPSEITVKPKELPFLDKPANALQPFTEIHTKDVKELELNLVEKNDETPIWEAVIRPEDLMSSDSSTKMQTEDLMSSDSSTKMQTDTHFVDRHREQLIQRVTAVDGILDLLHGSVLDIEQYQSVRAEKTNPAKMRKLYELAPSWNAHCKERFHQALREKHRHLVEDLEGR